MMIYSGTVIGLALVGVFGWNLIARGGYESAEYKVVESDGKFEVREYPDLMLAATTTNLDSQGRDGSFMKLFRYISVFYQRFETSLISNGVIGNQ